MSYSENTSDTVGGNLERTQSVPIIELNDIIVEPHDATSQTMDTLQNTPPILSYTDIHSDFSELPPDWAKKPFKNSMAHIIHKLDLPSIHKDIIRDMYIQYVVHYSQRKKAYRRWLKPLKLTSKLGSITVPAVIGLNALVNTSAIWWCVFVLSLIVAVCNNVLDVLKIPMNYRKFAVAAQKLELEGWAYVGLSGRYAKFETHDRAFTHFITRVQILKKRFIAEEFDNAAHPSGGKSSTVPTVTFSTPGNTPPGSYQVQETAPPIVTGATVIRKRMALSQSVIVDTDGSTEV